VAAGAQAVFDYAHATVRDEDYRLVAGLQANLESSARDHLLFGRNEPGLQHRHMSWASWSPVAAGTSSAVGG
jgi:carnitine monooxygenase subunit